MNNQRVRTRIERAVHELPGTHFNDLVRRLDLAPGQTQYHIRQLIQDGAVVRDQLYGRTHYYPPEFDEFERGVTALLRRETARDVLLFVLDSGPAGPGTVANELGIARSTLEWHLGHLVEQDVIRKRRDARNRVTLVLSRPADTVRLLAEIEPTVPERMVDRFTRLVDSVLEEQQ